MQKKSGFKKSKFLENLNSCAKDNEVDPMFAPISIKLNLCYHREVFLTLINFFLNYQK